MTTPPLTWDHWGLALALGPAACLPLSDTLEEHGRQDLARRLRTRYRRYLRARGKVEAAMALWESNMCAKFGEVARLVQRLGGTATVEVKASSALVDHQNTLLLQYVERLLGELSTPLPPEAGGGYALAGER